MRIPLHLGMLTGLLLVGSLVACNLPSTQIDQPETGTPSPAPTVGPTGTETPLPTAVPSNTAISASIQNVPVGTSTPKFAPFCQPSSANIFTPTPLQCQMPIAEQSSAFCSNKVPYNLILVNPGSTYESLNEDITCSEAGTKDGKQILTCTGPMGFPFDLRVCDPACAIPTFQAGTTHCPQDYNFNSLLGCCEQVPQPIDQNCVVLNLQVKRCATDCSAFTSRASCEENFYACKWDFERNVCQVRK